MTKLLTLLIGILLVGCSITINEAAEADDCYDASYWKACYYYIADDTSECMIIEKGEPGDYLEDPNPGCNDTYCLTITVYEKTVCGDKTYEYIK